MFNEELKLNRSSHIDVNPVTTHHHPNTIEFFVTVEILLCKINLCIYLMFYVSSYAVVHTVRLEFSLIDNWIIDSLIINSYFRY